ncbi:MAG: hypothetical protein ACNI3A_03580 [Desulfovibrio sp.]|uniref:hypothetical protein n=1 Tax=Desulfovibrio sp. 7SRBS1 TaxID=3378064 RepID=UPI003B3E0FE4
MSTILPCSELTKKAIEWISEGLKEGKPLAKLLDEGAMRFNLGPNDQEFLARFYKEKSGQNDDCQ